MTALRNRSLWIMAGAGLVSNLGNWVASQAVTALVIFDRGGDVAQTTLIFLSALLPNLLLGPFAGWLVDRVDRRRLMIASELLSGLVITGLIFFTSFAITHIAVLYPFVFLVSAAGTVMGPARNSVLPDLVPAAELTRANAMIKQGEGVTKVLAPLIGAAVVAVASPQAALALDLLSFGLSALILRRLPALPPRPAKAQPTTAATGTPGKVRILRTVLQQAPLLKVMVPYTLAAGVVFIAFDLTLAVYVRDILQGSIALQGLLVSLIGAGTAAAAFVLMLLKGRQNLERDYLFGLLLGIGLFAAMALGTLGSNQTAARGVMLVGCLLGGLGIGLENVQGSTLVQRIAPDGWLGRVNGSLQSLFAAGQAIGLLATPLLVPHVVSFGLYFGAGTVVLLLLTLPIVAGLYRGRLTGPVNTNEVASSD